MTDKLITQMIEWGIISEEEIDIYQFGLDVLFLKLFHYISYLLIAIFCGRLVDFIVFFLAYLCLRKNAGGYHSETKWGCYIWSCLTVIVVVLIMKYVTMHNDLIIMSSVYFIIADFVIILFAPLENRNRGLDKEERMHFRKRTVLVLITENILILLFLIIFKSHYAIPLILAVVCQAILLLLQKIKDNKYTF